MDSAALVAMAQDNGGASVHAEAAGVQLRAVLDVVWSKRRSFYDRALGVRALGVMLQRTPSLMQSVNPMRDDILDALVELADVCQHAAAPTADSRKVHVVCCLVLSMFVQGQMPVKNAVVPNSAMLQMGAAPSDGATLELLSMCRNDVIARGGYPRSRAQPLPKELKRARPRQAWAAASAATSHSSSTTGPLSPQRPSHAAETTSVPAAVAAGEPEDVPQQQRQRPSEKHVRWGFKRGASHDDTDTGVGAAARGTKQDSSGELNELELELDVDDMEVDPVADADRLPPLVSSGAAGAGPSSASKRRYDPTHSVLFGSEGVSQLGLDAEGNMMALYEPASPEVLGYGVSRTWFPVERPKTTDPAAAAQQKPLASTHLVGGSKDPAERGWGERGGVRGSMDVSLPSKMIHIDRPQLLPPQNFLRLLTDNAMPSAVPAVPERTTAQLPLHPEESPKKQHQKQKSRHKQKKTQQLAVTAMTVVSPQDTGQLTDAAAAGQLSQSISRQILSNEANTELQQLLSQSVVSHPAQTEAQMARVAAKEHNVLMNALQQQIQTYNNAESAISREIERTIQADWDKLPMRFLLQIPGGVEHYCQRVRRALGLWLAQFERAQCVRALRQWQAVAEKHRFDQRTVMYRRHASVKLFVNFLKRLVVKLQKRAILRWRTNVRWLIWIVRDAAALVVQTQQRQRKGKWALLALHDMGHIGGPLRDVYLAPPRLGLPFALPARLRAQRRPPWQATIKIQAPFRGRKWRRWFAFMRAAAIVIQAGARMWAKRDWYREQRRAAIIIQSQFRIYPLVWNPRPLVPAVRVLQRNWRAHLARTFLRVVLYAQRVAYSKKFHAPVVLQRLWRRGRWNRIEFRQDHRLRVERKRREVATFKLQRAWYTRPREPTGLGMFLQLGVMREVDREIRERDEKVEARFRVIKARVIQRFIRGCLGFGFVPAAIAIQVAWRRCREAGAVQARRKFRTAACRLRWWARGATLRRQQAAKRIQFAWWKCARGRFLRRLKIMFKQRQAAWRMAKRKRDAAAATTIQALVHGAWTRFWLKRTGAAAQVERTWRGLQGRRQWKAEWVAIRQVCATQQVQVAIQASLSKELERQWAMVARCRRALQASARGWLTRSLLARDWAREALEFDMSCRLQRGWSRYSRASEAHRRVTMRRRTLNNPYQHMALVGTVLRTVLQDAGAYFDEFDAEKGIGLATWLRRLGCDHHHGAFEEQRVTTLSALRKLNKDSLSEIFQKDRQSLYLVTEKLKGVDCADEVSTGFALLPDLDSVHRIYLEAYPGFASRAKAFTADCENAWSTFTPLLLQRFFARYELPGLAKQNIGYLLSFPQQAAEAKHDRVRVSKCADLYQYALDLIRDRFESSVYADGEVGNGFIAMLVVALRTKDEERAHLLRHIIDVLIAQDLQCVTIQRTWRGMSGRERSRARRHEVRMKELKAGYQHDRLMKKVRLQWELERKRAEEEMARWEEEQRVEAILVELEWSLQFGWKEEFEEESGTVYTNSKTHQVQKQRPTYSFAEDKSAREAQRIVRGFVGRRRALEQERVNIRTEAERKLQMEWDMKRPERKRYITVRLRVEVRRRESGDVANSTAVAVKAFCAARDADMTEAMEAASALPPNARPPDINALALLDLIDACDEQRANAQERVTTTLKFEYTRIGMPYGWEEVKDPNSGDVYYYNSVTQETAWDEPEFTFQESNAAGLIQRQYRRLLGRREFKRVLDSLAVEDVARHAIRDGKNTAWVGFGFEGMNARMWLTRMGMQELVEVLLPHAPTQRKKTNSSLTTEAILQLDDESLKARGVKSADTRSRIVAFSGIHAHPRVLTAFPSLRQHPQPLSHVPESWPKSFAFVAAEESLQVQVLRGMNQQKLRAGHVVTSILSSNTPVSVEQVGAHLRKYKGRPSEAQEKAPEQLCDQATLSTEEHIRACFQVYRRAADRLVVLAKNKRLLMLHRHLTRATRIAFGEASLVDTLQALEQLRCRGLWEPPDPVIIEPEPDSDDEDEEDEEVEHHSGMHPFYAALQLRKEVIGEVLRWGRAAFVVQEARRAYNRRVEATRIRNLRNASASTVQLAWLCCASRAAATLCRQQRASEWQQLWSADDQRYFFFHHPTKGAIWHEPRDPWGNEVPYRPQVKDRYSGRMIAAWPHLDLKSVEQGEDEADLCVHCHKEEATRLCDQCVDKSGNKKQYCFGCFHMLHQRDIELRGHTFTIMDAAWRPRVVKCIECGEAAALHCKECDDNYCDSCFKSMHRRGNKRHHTSVPISANDDEPKPANSPNGDKGSDEENAKPVVCVECGKPADSICEQCGDHYCSVVWMGNPGCFAKYHSKGNRRKHTCKPWCPPVASKVDGKSPHKQRSKHAHKNRGGKHVMKRPVKLVDGDDGPD